MNYIVLRHLAPFVDCHEHDFLVQYTEKYFMQQSFNLQIGKRILHLHLP